MTSPVQNSTAASAATGTPAAKNPNSVSAQQDKFLLMLTTQLKNQDPMNPMDNAAITTQMAQLSTVSGIDQLNSTLQALTSSMQTTSAASLIGHGVLVSGSSINLAGGQAAGGLNLAGPADNLSVTIKDAAGQVVQTLQLGPQKAAGVVPFAWNGSTAKGATAPDGAYTFTAEASQSGAISTPATLAFGTVNGVTPGAAGATVNVGSLGAFALSAVQQVL